MVGVYLCVRGTSPCRPCGRVGQAHRGKGGCAHGPTPHPQEPPSPVAGPPSSKERLEGETGDHGGARTVQA